MHAPTRLLFSVLFVLGLNCDHATAQNTKTGRVEGRVVTASLEAPLPDATVRIVGSDQPNGTTTGVDGRFVLADLPPGTTELRIRHVGYRPATRTVQVRAGETTRMSIQLEQTVLELSGLKITGVSRNGQATLPGTASQIDPAELEQIAPLGAQEALTYVPGIQGVSDDGMGQTRMSVGIRGLQPRRTQRVLVLEDGMPVQPAPYVFSPLYYNPPIERIEEVEVIKGSATVRHGPQTMAGVINYVTSRPQRRTLGGSLKLTSGTNGYLSAFGELGGFGSQALRPQVQVLFKRGDGFRENNDFTQLNGTAKLRYRVDESRSLYLNANVDYERLNATYTGLTPHTFRTNPNFNPKDDDVYRIFRGALGATYNRRYNDSVESTTKLYANVFDRPWWRENDVFVRASDYEENGVDAEPVPPSTPGPLVRVGISDVTEGNEVQGGYFGNERTFYVGGLERWWDIEHSLFGRTADLEAGGRIHWERFEDNRKIGDEIGVRDGVFFRGSPDDPTIVGQSDIYETTALALYALEDIELGALQLSPGVRLETFEQERIDRLADNQLRSEVSVVPLPSLGFNLNLGRYDLGPRVGEGQFNLFGGVHRGYTPPSSATFKIIGFDGPTASEEDNDGFNLRAEKSWNSELGIRGRTDAGRFEATGFYLYVEDLVGGRTRFRKNLGVVQSYGLEFEGTLDARVFAGPLPTLNVSYTLLRTEIVDGTVTPALSTAPTVDISGNELPAAPTHTGAVGLSKTFADLGLTLRTDLRYQGKFYTDLENLESTTNRGERGPVPSHTVLDASVTYAVSDALEIQLTAKNVTDNVYLGSRLHSNPRDRKASQSTGILPGPRRQVNFSFEYDF
ncbi:MAG: TonB-dependent receptor [Bacteroidetes bacterium QH_10_64_19]|nr:MAG: TonB-dependent receptor [Bacteroidetes bacterium QH_10_64_19]